MSEIRAVQAHSQNPLDRNEAPRGQNEIDKDLFLNLLVTQMRHQDPLSEQQNMGDFISQLTMFTLVEQMTSLQKTMEQQTEMQMMLKEGTWGMGMLNQVVELQDEAGQTVSGEVTAVTFDRMRAFVTVNGNSYPVGAVFKVGKDGDSTSDAADNAKTEANDAVKGVL